MSLLPSTNAHGTPVRRTATLASRARPEQRAAFHRRQQEDVDRITADMQAQRAAMLAKLNHGDTPRSAG